MVGSFDQSARPPSTQRDVHGTMTTMSFTQLPIPVLEVGGTHVSAAVVDTHRWAVASEVARRDVDSSGTADQILAAWADSATGLGPADAAVWAAAMPDPFDYERGVGDFHGVAKYEALSGVDVRAALLARLPGAPRQVVFCNDADAFTLGEAVAGAARDAQRCVGITLGTGVGSGWVSGRRIVEPQHPPRGRIHHVQVGGAGLEETMSRRAIRRAYLAATGDGTADVRDIADRARTGDRVAIDVLEFPLRCLGRVIAPLARDFGADVVVFGGSMTGSWDLLGPWLLADWDGPPVRLAEHSETAGLVGAAYHAATVSRRPSGSADAAPDPATA
jgi:glucokinase